jgi:hypothetical protein
MVVRAWSCFSRIGRVVSGSKVCNFRVTMNATINATTRDFRVTFARVHSTSRGPLEPRCCAATPRAAPRLRTPTPRPLPDPSGSAAPPFCAPIPWALCACTQPCPHPRVSSTAHARAPRARASPGDPPAPPPNPPAAGASPRCPLRHGTHAPVPTLQRWPLHTSSNFAASPASAPAPRLLRRACCAALDAPRLMRRSCCAALAAR